MKTRVARKVLRRVIIYIASFLVVFFLGLFLLARFYVEPTLRKKLQTLIVDGSDSLYTYKLEDLSTNIFGGNIIVSGFEMKVDSNRYAALRQANALPALVTGVNVKKASIRNLSIFSLLFSKKVYIDEISSNDADINLLRNFTKQDTSTAVTRNKQPLWKLLQPTLKDFAIERIKFEGIRVQYRNTEDIDAARLQFERCDALLEKIRIDSVSLADTARIGYVENFSLRLQSLQFQSPDSLYQMKAGLITYNSASRYLAIDSFNLKPSLNKYQRIDSMRKSWYTLSFTKVSFNGVRLDRYLRQNRAEADSVVFQSPRLAIFMDKAGLKSYDSKIGKYPHQQLLNAKAVIDIGKFTAHDMQVEVTERHAETRQEGTLKLDNLEVAVENIVNDSLLIARNPVATASAKGLLIGSPVEASFRFYLDSTEGRFDATGSLKNVKAAQINSLSSTLANVEVPSADIDYIGFFIRGSDYNALADVEMRYRNLSIVFLKRDEETGERSMMGFLTKLLNKYAIYTANPDGGTERKAQNVKVARLTTQSFFGVIWQAVFAGMQNIILKS